MLGECHISFFILSSLYFSLTLSILGRYSDLGVSAILHISFYPPYIQSQVTSTIAGDDGEAVEKSEQNAKKKVPEKPNEGLEKPADAGWYVAVVRVNCETRIADSIRINLNHNHVWFDYWIPKVKVVYICLLYTSPSPRDRG